MRADISIHDHRGRAQRTRDSVARETQEPECRGGVLDVDEDDVHVCRREDADETVAEEEGGYDRGPDAYVALRRGR